MLAGMHLKRGGGGATRGPVGRSLGASWAHKGRVGRFLDARGHWGVTWVMGAVRGPLGHSLSLSVHERPVSQSVGHDVGANNMGAGVGAGAGAGAGAGERAHQPLSGCRLRV